MTPRPTASAALLAQGSAALQVYEDSHGSGAPMARLVRTDRATLAQIELGATAYR